MSGAIDFLREAPRRNLLVRKGLAPTRRRTTDENIDVTVGPGRYYLIVSNRFSWMTGKTVMLDGVSAECVAPADAGMVTSDTGSVGDL